MGSISAGVHASSNIAIYHFQFLNDIKQTMPNLILVLWRPVQACGFFRHSAVCTGWGKERFERRKFPLEYGGRATVEVGAKPEKL